MNFATFIRGLVKEHPELKAKLKKADEKKTSFQYMVQTIVMTFISIITLGFVILLLFKNNLFILSIGILIFLLLIPLIYRFWLSYVDVQIKKLSRELEGDLLFVSEYFLVSLESGMPLGNAIEKLANLNRPGGHFFRRVFIDFQTGKDLEAALDDAITYAPSVMVKNLLKKLKDSLSIGVDLRGVLETFIEDSSERKLIEIKGFSKKLNPLVMMYLLLGIVLPSLGVTFFILAAALINITSNFLKYILIFLFLIMFLFQYLSYSGFKFSKATI